MALKKSHVLDLKPPISTYFEARNAHDGARTAALFTENGRVHDERNDHRGREAIQAWAEQTFSRYQMVQTPLSACEEDGATVVTAEVAGSFPGSPIELGSRFVVERERIRELGLGEGENLVLSLPRRPAGRAPG